MRMTGQDAAEEYRRRWWDQPEIDAHMVALLDDELIEMDYDTGLFYPTKLGMLVQRIFH